MLQYIKWNRLLKESSTFPAAGKVGIWEQPFIFRDALERILNLAGD